MVEQPEQCGAGASRRRGRGRNGLRLAFATVVVALSTLAAPAVGQTGTAATTIMPLGDSITEAKTGHASYRYWLWHQLIDAGHAVDLVGSSYGVRDGATAYTDIDQDHEGHWGWRADEVLAQVDGWTETAQPQIVLLHLGTNDMLQGQSIDSTIAELGAIIDEIRANRPDVVILFAQLIPANRIDAQIQQLNERIAQLASGKHSAVSPVILVDQYSGFYVTKDTYDGIHPNEAGEKKMAARWYTALSRVLPSATTSTTTTTTTAPPTTTTTAPTTTTTAAADTLAPSLVITQPANGSTVRRSSTVRVTVSAQDDRGIRKVELYVDGKRICTEWSSPYSCTFTTSSKAKVRHTIVADAYDHAGNTARATVSITTR